LPCPSDSVGTSGTAYVSLCTCFSTSPAIAQIDSFAPLWALTHVWSESTIPAAHTYPTPIQKSKTCFGYSMKPRSDDAGTGPKWPPEQGQKVTFQTKEGNKEGTVKEARIGLVWRDFLLEDGRMIAEHKIIGCPDPPMWRDPDTVSAEERKAWEERLISMAES